MPGKLKEVKTRINSVTSTQQITKAMKLVAASKLKKATDHIVQMRPYEHKLSEMMVKLVDATAGDINISLAKERPIENVLVVVITSDKGLCGGFNANIIKAARRAVTEKYAEPWKAGKVTILYIGKKGNDVLKKLEAAQHNTEFLNLMKNLRFDAVAPLVEQIIKDFSEAKFDAVDVCYAQFRNAAVQYFKCEQFLPIMKPVTESKKKNDYLFEPDQNRLVEELVPKILKTQFFRFMLDTTASEHGARMTAMDSATNNATELLRALKIRYNKERQAAITTELTEIVSGAAALENG